MRAVQSFGTLIYTGIAFAPISGLQHPGSTSTHPGGNSNHPGSASNHPGSTSNHLEGSSTSHYSGFHRSSPRDKTFRKIKKVPFRVCCGTPPTESKG